MEKTATSRRRINYMSPIGNKYGSPLQSLSVLEESICQRALICHKFQGEGRNRKRVKKVLSQYFQLYTEALERSQTRISLWVCFKESDHKRIFHYFAFLIIS